MMFAGVLPCDARRDRTWLSTPPICSTSRRSSRMRRMSAFWWPRARGRPKSQRRNLFTQYLNANVGGDGVTIAFVRHRCRCRHQPVAGRWPRDRQCPAVLPLHHLGMQQVSVVASTIPRSTKSMEIAVVLDNTGSNGLGRHQRAEASFQCAGRCGGDRAVPRPGRAHQPCALRHRPSTSGVKASMPTGSIRAAPVASTMAGIFSDTNLRNRRQNGERLGRLPEGFGSNNTGNGFMAAGRPATIGGGVPRPSRSASAGLA